jgi:hypothetical protein
METGKQYDPLYTLEKVSLDTINPYTYREDDDTGDELRITLNDESDKIIIVVWFNNRFEHEYQNKLNSEVRGSLMNIILHNHPHVEYHEADMSTYNKNAYTYLDLANELHIDLEQLLYSPAVLVMHNHDGEVLRSDTGSLNLVRGTDKLMHEKEFELYGNTNFRCEIETEIEGVNQFKDYHPWANYNYFTPDEKEKDKLREAKKNSKIQPNKVIKEPQSNERTHTALSEPEKSFFYGIARRRRPF